MKRREFLEKVGYGAAGFVAAPLAQESQEKTQTPPKRRRYKIEVEVFEGPKSRCHKVGDKFVFPQDTGKMCTWLLSTLDPVVTALASGGTLPWMYEGTPYEKVIDPDGITTEFIRCPDPTDAGIVVKITRTLIS